MLINIDLLFERRKSWEQWFLLSSDRHWDNPKSDLKLQKKHLDEAKERNAYVIDVGDFFCAMQGRNDRRGSKGDVRPEHQRSDYFTALVDTAVDWFKPYADRFLMIGYGNHETAIIKHNEIDLIAALTDRLKVRKGRYGGYLRLNFRQKNLKNKGSQSLLIRYFHGSGGGGPVTKGTIQTNRRAIMWPDADIVVAGHIHERWQLDIEQERYNVHANKIMYKTQTHVQLPTYKKEHGEDGWHDQRGAPPKPLGAAWLRVFTKPDATGTYTTLDWEVTWAK